MPELIRLGGSISCLSSRKFPLKLAIARGGKACKSFLELLVIKRGSYQKDRLS